MALSICQSSNKTRPCALRVPRSSLSRCFPKPALRPRQPLDLQSSVVKRNHTQEKDLGQKALHCEMCVRARVCVCVIHALRANVLCEGGVG